MPNGLWEQQRLWSATCNRYNLRGASFDDDYDDADNDDDEVDNLVLYIPFKIICQTKMTEGW